LAIILVSGKEGENVIFRA